jgi:hypothetical protein
VERVVPLPSKQGGSFLFGLDNAVIALSHHKTLTTQRQPKSRIIPLDTEVVELLISIRSRHEPGDCVFLNHPRTT